MYDVVLYDCDGAYCPPGLNAPVGGSEVELYQLRAALSRSGLSVLLATRTPALDVGPVGTLVYWRQVRDVTSWCQPARSIVRATDDPGDEAVQADGLLTVCVSEWQARKYRSPTRVVYPMLGLHVYEAAERWRYLGGHEERWIYASAANKGLQDTLDAWNAKPRGELVVTTTGYDEPRPGQCEAYGARWVGKVSPIEMAFLMSMCHGMYYRNRAPETFGVTTAIAATLGLELDIECVGHDACGLAESRQVRDLSEATIVQRWLEVLKC